jgi:hypothetical protein
MRRSVAVSKLLLVAAVTVGCGAVSGDPDAGPVKAPIDAGPADAQPPDAVPAAACVLDQSSIDHCTL